MNTHTLCSAGFRRYFLASFALVCGLGLVPALSAQQADAPSAAPLSEAATRGKAIFATNCVVCHNAENTDKKIGPGLKGLMERGTFTSDGTKITDESLTTFIQAGKGLMPPFKATLPPPKLDDVIAYLKTL